MLDAFSKRRVWRLRKDFQRLRLHHIHPDELASVLIFEEGLHRKGALTPVAPGEGASRSLGVAERGFRIGLLLKNVVEMGVRVVDRIKRVTHRVQSPVRDAQLWVLEHPAAGLLLELVEHGFDVLASLSIDDLAQAAEDLTDKDWKTFVKDAATGAAQGVADRGRDTLDALRHLELPEEVIPMEWIAIGIS